MGKSPVTPGQPEAPTNRGTEARTGPLVSASPSQRTAHVLLSASIAPPGDLTAQAVNPERLSLDESLRSGHVTDTDSSPQVSDHVHPTLPGQETP